MAFDAALVEGGFGISGTSAGRTEIDHGVEERKNKWDGISEFILGKKEWFDAWMEGERKCEWVEALLSAGLMPFLYAVAEDQYHEIISAPDAWLVADEAGEDTNSECELRSTNSARRIKALVEQVTGRFSGSFLS